MLRIVNSSPLPAAGRFAGIVTASELKALGFSDRQISTRTRRGELYKVSHGVYADGSYARNLLRQRDGRRLLELAAALAAAGPTAVASHESAAYLHSIALLSERESTATLTVPPRRGWTARAGVQLHAAILPAAHTTRVAGLLVTTVARTVADLARTLDFRAGLVAADSALYRRLTTKDQITDVLSQCGHWPGVSQAREVVAFADGRAESPLESIARVVFRDCGLPPAQLQVWLGGISEPIGRVDFYWERYWTIAEVDGALKYANPDRARAQLRRDSQLREDGFEVVHFTWQQITMTPQAVAASVRAAFQRGERNATRPGRSA